MQNCSNGNASLQFWKLALSSLILFNKNNDDTFVFPAIRVFWNRKYYSVVVVVKSTALAWASKTIKFVYQTIRYQTAGYCYVFRMLLIFHIYLFIVVRVIDFSDKTTRFTNYRLRIKFGQKRFELLLYYNLTTR